MLFMVFVGWYLHLDHAPWWVWLLALVASSYDLYQEHK